MGAGKGYVHYAAGEVSCLAAVPHQECPVPLPPEKGLGLGPVDVPQLPEPLVVVREVLVVIHHGVLTVGAETAVIFQMLVEMDVGL